MQVAAMACRAHPGEVTFLADHRADLPLATTPTLILQSTQDPVVPVSVGTYLHDHIPGSTLAVIENIGHYPHMSAPVESAAAMSAFLQRHAL